MKAVILAGGLGLRLRPLTQAIPKPLLPIGEKTVLEIQISNLKKHGFDEIYLATNYKASYIENYFGNGSKFGVRISFSKEDKPLGTAGPLSLLRKDLKEPFIMMNGDILSNIDFRKFYDASIGKDADLTVVIKRIVTPFAFGNIFYEGDYVTAIQEKPNIETDVLAGIYMIKPSLLDLIPDDRPYGMDQLIQEMLRKKIPVAKYELKELWLDIGQLEDYNKAQEEYERHFKDE
jgi:NDP-sugar pyrophosphorylase family protein